VVSAASLVVGRSEDPHAAAVAGLASEKGGHVVMVDAESLRDRQPKVDDQSVALKDERGRWVELKGGRGWLRRLAPENWRDRVEPGSHEGVVREAWLVAMTMVIEFGRLEWLTPLARVFQAEDKLLQQRACRSLEIGFVPLVLATSRDDIPAGFGDELVVKPVAAGHFRDEAGLGRVVHATAMTREDERLELLGGAPFFIQPRLEAARHLRVVTVLDRAWVAALNATEMPLDWRAADEAHSSFEPVSEPTVSRDALRLADALGVAYSSQDWLVDTSGARYFLDLNPAGQWLFLPAEIADAVTEAISTWLIGEG